MDEMRNAPATPRRRNDAGISLPEILISMSVMAVLVTAISAALIGMLNISTQATRQLSESNDISFAQTRLPVDLGSSLAASDDENPVAAQAEIAAQLTALGVTIPPMGVLDGLPGTNVITLVRPGTSGAAVLISYRYEFVDGDYVVKRYEFTNPADPNQVPMVNLVVTELAAPPSASDSTQPAWQDGDPIDFAVKVTAKANGNRPSGRDVTFTFESDRTFATGGAGLSAQQALPPADFPGLDDPLAPPSRCGKRIALIIDTSGSIPQGSGGTATEQAAIGFIDGFLGTPTTISLNGFDRTGYGMSIDLNNPATIGQRSPFYSVLNDDAQVSGMRTRIAALDDTDGMWGIIDGDNGSLLMPGNPANRRDPDANGIFWGQVGDGTNWEGGLLNVYQDASGNIYASEQPDLVVFITDGEPNFKRNNATGGIEGVVESDAAGVAADVSSDLQGVGAQIIGVMVGNKRANPTYVDYLRALTSGGETWSGGVNNDGSIDLANAATADLFLGGFNELGPILRSIVIGQCGGTVTIQKRIDDGAGPVDPASGVWSYASNDAGVVGIRVLDRSAASSVTFDYSFGPSEGTKVVQLTEQPVDGSVFDRAECTADGTPVPAVPNVDGSAGATVTIGADQAVSCLMISSPA